MFPNLDAYITAGEFQSLRDVSKGATQRAIPPEHKIRLLQVGYIMEGLSGLAITDVGQMRVAEGR
jgi:hypothetical protein